MNKSSVLFILYGDRITIYEDLIKKLNKQYDVVILHRGSLKAKKLSNVMYTELTDDAVFKKLDNLYNFLVKFEQNVFVQICLEKLLMLSYSYIENYAITFFKQHRIKCLYVYNDKFPSSEIAFLKSAKRCFIPVVLSSQVHIEPDISIFSSESYLHRVNSYSQTVYQKYIFKKFSAYKELFFKGYSWYKPFELNALHKKGLLSKKPWLIGSSGLINKLCVSTKVYSNFLIENGIKKEIINIIGAISYDILYKRQRAKHNQKIAILALPQFYEHGFMTKNEAMQEHEFILNALQILKEYKLVISLHPTMNYDDYLYLEELYDCKISQQRLDEILSTADLFICTPSTTIQWAILLQVRTIVIDFYQWKNSFWDTFNSFLYISNKNKIEEQIRWYLNKKVDFSHDEMLLSKNMFDGQVLNRYQNLTNRLILNSPIHYIDINKISLYFISVKILKWYIKFKNIRKIKKIRPLIKGQTSYYLAPYSKTTQETKFLIESINPNIKFCGYIDSFKEGKNIIKPNETGKNKTLIIIESPSSGELIKNCLLQFNEENLLKSIV